MFAAILLLGSAALVQDRAACSRQFSVRHAHLGLEGVLYERQHNTMSAVGQNAGSIFVHLFKASLGSAAKNDFAHEFTGLRH